MQITNYKEDYRTKQTRPN